MNFFGELEQLPTEILNAGPSWKKQREKKSNFISLFFLFFFFKEKSEIGNSVVTDIIADREKHNYIPLLQIPKVIIIVDTVLCDNNRITYLKKENEKYK